MRRIFLTLTSVLVLVVTAAPAHAAGQCAARFPGAGFDTRADAGVVSVVGVGLNEELTARYARVWAPVVDLLQNDFGTLEGVEVCVFENEVPLDSADYDYPDSLPIRSIAFADEGMVVLSAWRIAGPLDAGLVGLVHIAQVRAGGGSYPEPLGADGIGYYRNRVEGTTDAVHNRFVRSNVGLREPWPPIPWLGGEPRSDILAWNAEQAIGSQYTSGVGYGGAGEFTNHVVLNGGPSVLANPDPGVVATLDEGWRQQLFDESGSIPGGSRGWIKGVLFAVGAVVLGIGVAVSTRLARKRQERYLLELADDPRIPAFAPEDTGPIRTSPAGSLRRRDAGVGGRRSRAVGRDLDDRNRAPSGRKVGRGVDVMPAGGEARDDAYRHPGFDRDD